LDSQPVGQIEGGLLTIADDAGDGVDDFEFQDNQRVGTGRFSYDNSATEEYETFGGARWHRLCPNAQTPVAAAVTLFLERQREAPVKPAA
jgi:hypothetical protein